MPEVCLNSWQANPCESFFRFAWRSWDVIERGIFVVLALMLAYTLVVLIRFCLLSAARRESADFGGRLSGEFFHGKKNLLAELSPALGATRGISSAAPLLGLTGTSYGILCALSFGGSMSKATLLAVVSARMATALPATLAAILVAVLAIVVHNFLRTRVEECRGGAFSTHASSRVGSFRPAPASPLKRRFSGLPQYALLASPTLACVLALFTPFHPYRISAGFPVSPASFPCHPDVSDRLIVLRIMNTGDLFINSETASWEDLSTRLSSIYRAREHRELYLLVEEKVPFQTVADALDVTKNIRDVDYGSLDIKVDLITPNAEAESEKCFALIFGRLRRRALRKSK